MSAGRKLLHVYGPDAFHDDVFIVGTPDALRALAKTVDRAIRYQEAELPECMFVNDGEGFQVRVLRVDDEKTALALAVPYTADYAQDKRDDCLWPEELLIKYQGGKS